MRRLMGPALVIGIVAVLASACGGSGEPAPTVAPELRTATAVVRDATATADAEAAYQRRPPCVLDRTTLGVVDAISDTLWRLGTQIGERDATLALEYYEASIAYGLVAECRETGATPVPSATPAACPEGVEEAIDRLGDAWSRGTGIVVRLLLVGVAPEDVDILIEVNSILVDREADLRVACGLARPATPGPVASTPTADEGS